MHHRDGHYQHCADMGPFHFGQNTSILDELLASESRIPLLPTVRLRCLVPTFNPPSMQQVLDSIETNGNSNIGHCANQKVWKVNNVTSQILSPTQTQAS